MKRTVLGTVGAALALGLAACASSPPEGPSPGEAVMKAQFAAKPAPEDHSMSGEEADRIYKNYLDRIGKPLERKDSETTDR